MKSGSIIEEVTAREVLDSRGNPTVEACVKLSDGSVGYGISPSGASTGIYEALELRDNDKKRYMGKGVLNAVKNVNTVINDTLKGMESGDIYAIDAAMIKADSAYVIVSDLREKFLFQFRLLRREGSAEGYFVVIHGLPLLCHFLVFVKR